MFKRVRGSWKFKRILKQLERTKSKVPKELGMIAKSHFQNALQKEGFTDNGFVKWEEVNRRKKGHKQFKAKQQQKMLVGFGGSGFQKTISIAQAKWSKILVVSRGKPYAKYHNDGTQHIPQRQFMGDSRIMRQKIKRHFEREVKKVMR